MLDPKSLGLIRPSDYGAPTDGTSPASTGINAAIQAISSGTANGILFIDRPYALDAPLVVLPGVRLLGTANGNRQNYPNTFTGGYLFPHGTFPQNTAMIQVGTSGNFTTNPCSVTFEGIGVSGMTADNQLVTGCAGLSAIDTADVHILNCFFANFDRSGGTGTAIAITATATNNGVGFEMSMSMLSNCYNGLILDGVGATDARISDNLFHSNTKGLSLGPTAGGGGCQLINNHYAYPSMPSVGFHLYVGVQAGDYIITNEYFDKAGSAVCVQLASAKGKFSGNHFLADPTSTVTGLVKLSTGGSQQITFTNNQCNANGSSIQSLLWTSAHAGLPTGGVYAMNTVYGTATSLLGVVIDSAQAALAAADSASLYVQGNVVFS